MAFVPLVAHAIAGETRRGIWFSLPLLVPVAVQGVVVGFYPNVLWRAPAGIQWTTYASVAVSIFGSIFGVLDAVRAGEREPKSAPPSISVVPTFGDRAAGALLTGSL
ncbi:MAG: hypothetical protein KIT84_44765 [Labilithrix sp.]|nr:hypothetical protein [Labilithrix sp.]MCW5818194.1 hypothetical protein [Labilithrix sp.]